MAAGDPAPDVTLTLTDGTRVALASLKGKRVLIYFYPKDDTPGCTAEAKGIRDAWPDLQAAGLAVYGVSTQDADSHQAFIDKYSLPFPLAVDDGALADAFQVPRRFGLTARQSFLVGVDGELEHVWREVSAATHAADVLAVIR
ncbi:MAG: peroxiredoxin [Deltaproteobacteria bacterium HGW-Deltaproteobacteria-14]|nr:MAG: peroxiredoxin [Deltaproteobacteria bacterium HGW-Deltaproteobacteria-14]